MNSVFNQHKIFFVGNNGFCDESLDFGVRASALNIIAGIFAVSGSTFTDCFTGIYTTLADGYLISGNTFHMNRPDDCDNLHEAIVEVFDIVRPQIVSNGSIDSLSAGMLSDLEAFAERCDEAGYLALELLKRNNIVKAVNCTGIGSKQAQAVVGDHSTVSIAKKIAVFPNPANDQVNIDAGENHLIALNLISVTGKVLKELNCAEKSHEAMLSLNEIPPGIYFLHVYTGQSGFQASKIVVQH